MRSKPCSERMKLPVRTQATSSFWPMARGSICASGQVHERAGGADDERRHAGDAGGDGVGQGEAVERGDRGRAEILEGQDEDGVLRALVVGGFAEALGEHGEQAGGALLLLGGSGGRQDGGSVAGDDAGFQLQRLHDGLQRFADFGGAASSARRGSS